MPVIDKIVIDDLESRHHRREHLQSIPLRSMELRFSLMRECALSIG